MKTLKKYVVHSKLGIELVENQNGSVLISFWNVERLQDLAFLFDKDYVTDAAFEKDNWEEDIDKW